MAVVGPQLGAVRARCASARPDGRAGPGRVDEDDLLCRDAGRNPAQGGGWGLGAGTGAVVAVAVLFAAVAVGRGTVDLVAVVRVVDGVALVVVKLLGVVVGEVRSAATGSSQPRALVAGSARGERRDAEGGRGGQPRGIPAGAHEASKCW